MSITKEPLSLNTNSLTGTESVQPNRHHQLPEPTSPSSSSLPSSLSLVVAFRLLKSMLQNVVHCQDFINLGTLDYFLGLLGLRSIPYDFATTPAAQASSSTIRIVNKENGEEEGHSSSLTASSIPRTSLVVEDQDRQYGSSSSEESAIRSSSYQTLL
ncbi:hypothetical protein PSTG_02290 [Puccinia striiformis f. sp. tritici PST-78]|uniref:DUF913 domain-containing protein n=2 Tax=Puccinia striiformis f. sp. tritici TaxID=168172 RepID=A0A0L0VYI7_9BASI|nr:hypothetical protein PSTG_02290 [Puccinia striiformis f. sp. tritici PST-78]